MNHRCANKPPIDEISVLTPFPGECGGGGLELPSSLWKESEEHLPAGHIDLFMPLYQVLGKKSLPVFSFFQAQALKVGQATDPLMTGASSAVGAAGHDCV